MSEARLAFLAVKVLGALVLVVVIGGGSRALWVIVAAAIPVFVLLAAHTFQRLRGARPPELLLWAMAKRAGGRVRGLGQRLLAAARGARRRGRVRWVELVALEAAEEDDGFSPERVRTAAESLFRLVQLALDARAHGRLSTLLAPELLAEWEFDVADVDLRERVEVVGDVGVEYVGFTTPEGAREARAVVLIEAALRAYTEDDRGRRARAETRRVCQYWTLALREGLWVVLSIEERARGGYHLAEPVGAPSAPR